MQTEAGVLILAATPIGDVEDASPALRRAILQADVIAAEDTRRFRDLCRRLGLEPTASVVSYFEGNEASRTGELVDAAAAHQRTESGQGAFDLFELVHPETGPGQAGPGRAHRFRGDRKILSFSLKRAVFAVEFHS